MNEMFQNFTFSFDSSDGRAGDCSCEKQESLGHWFESGSKEQFIWFLLTNMTYDNAC